MTIELILLLNSDKNNYFFTLIWVSFIFGCLLKIVCINLNNFAYDLKQTIEKGPMRKSLLKSISIVNCDDKSGFF